VCGDGWSARLRVTYDESKWYTPGRMSSKLWNKNGLGTEGWAISPFIDSHHILHLSDAGMHLPREIYGE
jgi:hypothetical protein